MIDESVITDEDLDQRLARSREIREQFKGYPEDQRIGSLEVPETMGINGVYITLKDLYEVEELLLKIKKERQ